MDSQLSPAANAAVSSAVIDQLARTKGWTRFISVLLWIGAAFLILGGIAMIAFGGVMGLGGMSEEMGGAEMFAGAGMGVGMGIIYLILSIIYVYPALKLGKFSTMAGRLQTEPSEAVLVTALNEQRAFWKYIGIWMIVMLVLYPIAIVVAVAIPAIAGAGAAVSG